MQDKFIFNELIEEAKKVVGRTEAYSAFHFGSTASALRTKNNNIYTGISLVSNCGLGICAERAAIMEMLKHRETEITHVISIYDRDKNFLPPCGCCRELIKQTNIKNLNCKFYFDEQYFLLKDLLPFPWINWRQTEEK